MKLIFKTLLIAFIISSCSAQEKSVEDDLYLCLVEHFEANNIELESALDSLEDCLISNGILSNKDGSGKVQYYEKIIESGIVPNHPETNLMKSLFKAYVRTDVLIDCLKSSPDFDSTEFHKTPFYLNNEKIEKDVIQAGQVSPVTVSKALISNLSEDDFEHPFYRAHMLLSFVMTNERDEAYTRTIPKRVESTESFGGFEIDIKQDGIFLVDGKGLSSGEIEAALVGYFQAFDKSTHVRVKVGRKTPYSQFAELQIILDKAYKRFWQQISLKDYQKNFDQLSTIEMDEIKALYPSRVIEVIEK